MLRFELSKKRFFNQKSNECFSRLNVLCKDINLNDEILNKKSDIMKIYINNFGIYDGLNIKNAQLPNDEKKEFPIKFINGRNISLHKRNKKLCTSIDDSVKLNPSNLEVNNILSKDKFYNSSRCNPISLSKEKSKINSNFFMTSLNTNSTAESTIPNIFIHDNENKRIFKRKSNPIKTYYTSKTKKGEIIKNKIIKPEKIQSTNNLVKTHRNFNSKTLKGKIDNIYNYNLKVGNKISNESYNNNKTITNILKSNLNEATLITKEEFHLLKQDHQNNNQFWKEVKTNKGFYKYISEDKANLFKISDVVSRMNEASCLHFNKIMNEKYKEVAEKTKQLTDYKFQIFLKKHSIKNDKLTINNSQINLIKKSMFDTYRNALNLRCNFISHRKENNFTNSNEISSKLTNKKVSFKIC